MKFTKTIIVISSLFIGGIYYLYFIPVPRFEGPINLFTSWALSDGGSYGVEFYDKDGVGYILSIKAKEGVNPDEFPVGYAIKIYGVYVPFFVPKNSNREKQIAINLDKTIKSYVSSEELAKFSDKGENEEIMKNSYWPLFVVSNYIKKRNNAIEHNN